MKLKMAKYLLNAINITWKMTQITCLKILFLIIHMNEISGFESGRSNNFFHEKLKNDIIALKNSEPGFNFTEQEMVKLKIWPQGIVPYYIDPVSYDAELSEKLSLFLESVNHNAGVHFLKLPRPPKDEKFRWVFFVNRRGVLDSGGYTTKDFTNLGVQRIVLGYNSPYNGELYETTLAILGIPPQHNAPDRDKYITVNFDNIMPDKQHLFNVLKDKEWLFHDLDYDYYSAGHYGLHKYSVNGHATIEPKYQVLDGIGDGQGFSFTDTWKIRMLYNYIEKTSSQIIKASDCKKMFKPGPKFNNFNPKKLYRVQLRKKPDRYLGKPNREDKDQEYKDNTSKVDGEDNEEDGKNNNNKDVEDKDEVKKSNENGVDDVNETE